MIYLSPEINWNSNGTYKSSWSFPLELEKSGDTEVISFNNLTDISSIDTIELFYNGKTVDRFLRAEFRILYITGENSGVWSEWVETLQDINSNYNFSIEIKIQRSGSNNSGLIIFSQLILNGKWIPPIIEGNQALDIKGKSIILSSVDVWKVFSLSGIDVVGENLETVSIKYRVSQDQGRSWTTWYEFNDNIVKELRPDPIRFFIIQYYIEQTSDSISNIYKIDLIGDFINVTQNYNRSNRLGIRSDCNNNNTNGNTDTNSNGDNTGNCSPNYNPYTALMNQISCNPNGFWRPYDKNKAIQLYEFQSKLAQDTLGWNVDYYKSDVDRKGRDVILNEYQLFNITCQCTIKVLVPGNKFPDNQIEFNGTDLSDIQLFEIHILRDEFKRNFGIETRPEKGDIIFFCENNRLYRVEHAGSQRKFMNATVFYRVMLRKYNQQANTRISDSTASQQLKALTDQTKFEELLGKDIKDQYKKIANKVLNTTLSKDPVRTKDGRKAKRVEYKLTSGPNTIAERYYDTSSIQEGTPAIIYTPLDIRGVKGIGRCITVWFQLQSIGYRSNIIHNWENGLGYFLDVNEDGFYLQLNDDEYWLESTLKIGIWYGLIIQWNPSQNSIEMYLHTRKEENNRGSDPTLLLIDSKKIEMIKYYEWDIREEMMILGGKLNITSIRVWRESMNYENILPELIIDKVDDEHMAILIDNIEKRVKTTTFVPTPDPKLLSPPNPQEINDRLEIKIDKLIDDIDLNVISNEEFLKLDTNYRLKYLQSKTNVGITDYIFDRLNSDEMVFVTTNYYTLSNYQFNKLDDTNKIAFLNRLAINNPTRLWITTNNIISYGIIPDSVFSLMSEIVVDTVISLSWRIPLQQWLTLLVNQKYNYLQIDPRNKLVPTPPQQIGETISQFDARLNQQYDKLQKVQAK